MRVTVGKFSLTSFILIYLCDSGSREGDDKEKERAAWCFGPACQRDAVIMTGSGETTVKETDDGARDKSCDGNACHIDEAMPREVNWEWGQLHILSPSISA